MLDVSGHCFSRMLCFASFENLSMLLEHDLGP